MQRVRTLVFAAVLGASVTAAAWAQEPVPPAQPVEEQATTTTELPATASSVPTIGVVGLAMIMSGLWMSRPRRPV